MKVIGTFHPANILRNWKNRVVALADLIKASREMESPIHVRPKRSVLIEPELSDIQDYLRDVVPIADLISIDIETARGMITCIGFSADYSSALVVPFVDKRKPGFSYWPTASDEREAWKLVKAICESPAPKLGQNFLYDMQWLWKHNIRVRNHSEDTMILHHALFPEMPKSLAFLGSVYTDEASWKLWAPRRYGKTQKLEDTQT